MTQDNDKIGRRLAKQALKEKGYTYRTAAPVLGVCYQHLCFVLNGQRASQRLLQRIASLPRREEPAAVAAAPVSEQPAPAN